MPKILIKETDNTSPGTPGDYSNYAVLIAGFAANVEGNNVFEFSSAEDFKKTVGLVAPRHAGGDGSKEFYHYGNQMAYELLNMGYSIIYKTIADVADLATESFWEEFKDKANYDFRFITHGLLKSSTIDDEANYKTAMEQSLYVYEAKKELSSIAAEAVAKYGKQTTDNTFEIAEFKNTQYKALLTSLDATNVIYKGLTLIVTTGDEGEKSVTSLATEDIPELYSEAEKNLNEVNDLLTNLINGYVGDGIDEGLINNANGVIANLAKYVAEESEGSALPGRGDCVALIEVDENAYISGDDRPENLIIKAINKMSKIDAANGKYCALTVPSVVYSMSDYEKKSRYASEDDKDKAFENNKTFPGAFHYLACFKNSLQLGFAEWYAAAGYTRGVSSFVIDHTTVKLGEVAINALEPRNYDDPQSDYPKFACNVIANFRGSYYLWGNRTAHPLGKKGSLDTGDLVASHFLNIRQLCTTIKKQLYVACRRFTFDPNSDTLWVNFTGAIKPTLERMKADQGIRDYKIIKEFTDKKATLKAKIRIIPIEAVEDFDLEVSLEDSFGETAAVVTE